MTDPAARQAGFRIDILPQPDDLTCGPTCLHAIYRWFGDEALLQDLVDDMQTTPSGGTADVYLANHALRRGYSATIYTYNLRLFDPTWFATGVDLRAKLMAQAAIKAAKRPVFGQLTEAYVEYLDRGGKVEFADLTPTLLRGFLKRGIPILTGLSSTYLYNQVRVIPETDVDDDVHGEPEGHFVVLCGYRSDNRQVVVADPFAENPVGNDHHYEVALDRVIGAIMLGVLTHDASLLIIEPADRRPNRLPPTQCIIS